jgi:periplasmic divalent cation tolerance protein
VVSDTTGCCQVTTTFPDRATAEQVAARLVEERLAACAQVLGPVDSTYWWQDKVERSSEWYCHFKTTVERFAALEQRLRKLHPYETPELVATPITEGSSDYLSWIRASVHRKD